MNYFTSVENVFDLSGMIIFVVWAQRHEAKTEGMETSQVRLLTLAELSLTAKGILHLRFWSKMRFELKMIKQVIADMKYFLLLVMIFVVQYTVVFYINNKEL